MPLSDASDEDLRAQYDAAQVHFRDMKAAAGHYRRALQHAARRLGAVLALCRDRGIPLTEPPAGEEGKDLHGRTASSPGPQ